MGSRVAVIFLIGLVGGACGGPGASAAPTPPSGHTTNVSLSLYAGNVTAGQKTCDTNAFGTLYMNVPGSKVTVVDQSNTLIGTTTVPLTGVLVPGTGPEGLPGQHCRFTFSLELPDSATFYTFKVGDIDGPTYSHADMVTSGWSISLQ